MHLLYADGSGDPQSPKHQFYVLGGFSTFERQPFWLSEKLDKIAARFSDDPSAVELHGSPMRTGNGMWRTFHKKDRCQAILDSLSVLAESHPSNTVFGVSVRKADISPRDPVEFSFEQMCSRFDQYLMRLHRGKDTQRGLILFDKEKNEGAIQRLAADFRKIGHTWGVVRNLAEVPVFIDSKASRLIQLADLIAYAIFRKVEFQDPQFFEVIANRFDAVGGVVHGYYQYPK